MKGISNAISMIIIFVILVSISVPMFFYMEYASQYDAYLSSVSNNNEYLRQLQMKQIEYGNPLLIYNGSTIFAIYVGEAYVPQTNITVVGILYLNNNSVWENITSLKYPLVISNNTIVDLPNYAQNRPIIIVTSMGNMIFLTPAGQPMKNQM